MGCNPPCPRFEAAFRVEARMCLMHPPEGFDSHIFGCSQFTNDTHHPALNGALMHAEQCLEGFDIAVPKPREDAVCIVPHQDLSFLTLACEKCPRKVTPDGLRRREKRF